MVEIVPFSDAAVEECFGAGEAAELLALGGGTAVDDMYDDYTRDFDRYYGGDGDQSQYYTVGMTDDSGYLASVHADYETDPGRQLEPEFLADDEVDAADVDRGAAMAPAGVEFGESDVADTRGDVVVYDEAARTTNADFGESDVDDTRGDVVVYDEAARTTNVDFGESDVADTQATGIDDDVPSVRSVSFDEDVADTQAPNSFDNVEFGESDVANNIGGGRSHFTSDVLDDGATLHISSDVIDDDDDVGSDADVIRADNVGALDELVADCDGGADVEPIEHIESVSEVNVLADLLAECDALDRGVGEGDVAADDSGEGVDNSGEGADDSATGGGLFELDDELIVTGGARAIDEPVEEVPDTADTLALPTTESGISSELNVPAVSPATTDHVEVSQIPGDGQSAPRIVINYNECRGGALEVDLTDMSLGRFIDALD
jgi:hypothetical protein